MLLNQNPVQFFSLFPVAYRLRIAIHYNTVQLCYNAVLGVHGSDQQYIRVEGYNAVSPPQPTPSVNGLYLLLIVSYYEHFYYISYHILRRCFLPYMAHIFHFKHTLKCCLQFASIWTILKFCCLVMGYTTSTICAPSDLMSANAWGIEHV